MYIVINHKAHKRFVKDFSLPIQILQNPYFEYFKNLYDKTYQSNEKYKLFQNTVNTLGSIDQFFLRLKELWIILLMKYLCWKYIKSLILIY